jgi:hypothetical protein
MSSRPSSRLSSVSPSRSEGEPSASELDPDRFYRLDEFDTEPTVFDRNNLLYRPAPKAAATPRGREYLWKQPKQKKITFGGRSRFKDWKWDNNEKDIIFELLKNRAKFSYIPDLSAPRSAEVYMINRGLDPSKFAFQMKDLDNDRKGKTPKDLIIYYRNKEGNVNPQQLYAAGGYLLKDYTARDVLKENITRNYYDGFPTRESRELMPLAQAKKIYLGTSDMK